MTRSLRADPWESNKLPWALSTISQNPAAVPESEGRARGSACARAAGKSISRGVGTSATARIQNACGKSAVGRRHGGRPNVARPQRSKRGTQRLNACAAAKPSPRRKQQTAHGLRRRVVTQQKFFLNSLCDRPGCYDPPAESIRSPARYCCRACRQAVRNVLDRERKWRSRGTLAGRLKRDFEYSRRAGTHRRQSQRRPDDSGAAPPRAPPR